MLIVIHYWGIFMLLEVISHLVLGVATVTVLVNEKRRIDNQINRNQSFKVIPSIKGIDSFIKQVNLLEEASNKYFNTLNEAGLAELVKVKFHVMQVLEDINNLKQQGNFSDAYELAQYLNNPEQKPYIKLFELTKADLNFVESWRSYSQSLIMNCTVQLGIASNQPSFSNTKSETKENFEQRRRRTFTALSELKEILMEGRNIN
jgi:hypothetical protein